MATPLGADANLTGVQTDERARIENEQAGWKSALLEMLIQDARDGSVKDPFKRNAKGRDNRRAGARIGRRSGPQARLARTGLSPGADEAVASIDAAESAVNTLRQATADPLAEEDGRVKVVNLARLV